MKRVLLFAVVVGCASPDEPPRLADIQTTVVTQHDDAKAVLAAPSACAGAKGDAALLHAYLDGAELSGEPDSPAPDTPDLARGATLFAAHCAACHGAKGDGNGPEAPKLKSPPRDLATGNFQLRTTETGELPRDTDLFRTISRGIHGTGMPPWFVLPEADRWALVGYVKSLSTEFSDDTAPPPIAVAAPPAATPDLIAKGQALFTSAGCSSCHGEGGKGDGPAGTALPIKPRDLTGAGFHRGSRTVDIFTTISTGLDGSPMGSFSKMVSEADRWALATYVHSIAAPYQDGPNGLRCPATPRKVDDELIGIAVQQRGMK